MAACLRFTRRVLKSFLDCKGYVGHSFPNLIVQRATPGLVEASLKIEPYHLNSYGTVHGGLVLTLTDTLGSLAIASKGNWMTGVSTDMGATFVRPAGRPGETLRIRANLTGIGRAMAYTRVEFVDTNGEMVAYGHHTKYMGKSSEHAKKNVKFSEDGEVCMDGEDISDVE